MIALAQFGGMKGRKRLLPPRPGKFSIGALSGHCLVLSIGSNGFAATLDCKGRCNALGEADSPESLRSLISPHSVLPVVFRLPEGEGYRGTLTLPLVDRREVRGLAEAELAGLLPEGGGMALALLKVERDIRTARISVEYVATPKTSLDRWLLLAARWGIRPNALEICGTRLSLLVFRSDRPQAIAVWSGLSCAALLLCAAVWIAMLPEEVGRSAPGLQFKAEMVALAEQMQARKAARSAMPGETAVMVVPGFARLAAFDFYRTRPVSRYELVADHAGSSMALIGWFVETQTAGLSLD